MDLRLTTLASTLGLALAGGACDSSFLPGGPGGPGGGGGNGGGPGGGGAAACKSVDLVISLDDSGSMQEEKEAMRDVVFPAMAERLLTISDGLDDFRVGVMDACPTPAVFHTRGEQGECNFSSGKAWMEHDSPRLIDEFQCVGEIDSSDTLCSGKNDDEQPASTISAALSGPMAGSGFLRDDALLVAIAITDEDEQPTPDASAREVYESLVAIKGDVNRIVFLGVGGARDCDGVYGEADHARKLQEIAGLFAAEGQGLFWDLCNGRLEDGLEQVMTVIEAACDDFTDPDPECVHDDECGEGEFCGEDGTCRTPIL